MLSAAVMLLYIIFLKLFVTVTQIVCRVCSRGRMTLPFTGHRRPCRVCDNCLIILDNKVKRGLKQQPTGSSLLKNGDLIPPLHDSLLSRSNRPLCTDVSMPILHAFYVLNVSSNNLLIAQKSRFSKTFQTVQLHE